MSTLRAPALARTASIVLVVAVLGFGVGMVMTRNLPDGIVLIGLGAFGIIMLRRPEALSIIALCAVFLAQRGGGASSTPGAHSGLSYADAVLALASLFAVPLALANNTLRRLRLPLIGLAIYLLTLVPSLVLHSSRASGLEAAHRVVLVGGALLVGASISQRGSTTTALRALVLVATVYGALTILDGARSGFTQPAGPLSLNKNFVGALLGDVAVVVIGAAPNLRIPAPLRLSALVVICGGLLASQSRGSMLAAAVGVYVAVALSGRVEGRGRRLTALAVAVGLSVVTFASVKHQFDASTDSFNNGSIGVRYQAEHITQRIWRSSPVTGVGIRYFNTGNFGPGVIASNNAINSELAESGVIGATGFLVMQGVILYAGFRRRRDGGIALVGLGVVLGSLTHGMVDIYWSAGVTALPFMLLGIGLGAPRSESDVRPQERVGLLEDA